MTICSCYKTLHKIKIHNNYLLDLMTVPKNIYFIILLIYLINQFSYTFALISYFFLPLLVILIFINTRKVHK